ncbi:MAG TPA: CHAT domain-containing protein, partial [Saprospiraceae bacterium]|nr:CHAT domain-containing protein [Saprospiraceae bacterium]
MKTFFSFLGNSCVYDELRGNFAMARQLAESKCQQDPHNAESWLNLGIVQLLQGDCIQARASFSQTERLASGDNSLLLNAVCWQSLTDKFQFEFNPEGSKMTTSVELNARYPPLEQIKYNQQIASLRAANPEAEGDAVLIHDYLSNLFTVRSFADAGNLFLDYFNPFMKFSEQNNLPANMALGLRHLADLYRRLGDLRSAHAALNDAEALYNQLNDPVGQGLCVLLRADWLLAPVSSPLALNAFLEEGTPMRRWQEFGILNIDSRQLGDLLKQAETIFGSSDAIRPFANLFLRAGFSYLLQGDFKTALEMTAAAKKLFDEAGDLLGAYLALTHQVVYLVGAGDIVEINDLSAQIGTWGKTSGSFSYAQGLGILINRMGNLWLEKGNDPERGLRLFQASEALFAALGAERNTSQSLKLQSSAFEGLNDSAAALAAYDKAMGIKAGLPEADSKKGFLEDLQNLLSKQKMDMLNVADKPSQDNNTGVGNDLPNEILSPITQLQDLNGRLKAADADWEAGKDEAAIKQYRQLIVDATNAKAWMIVAVVHLKLRENELAVESYEKFLIEDPMQKGGTSFIQNAINDFLNQNPSAAEQGDINFLLSNLAGLSPDLTNTLENIHSRSNKALAFTFFTRCKAWHRAQDFYNQLRESGGEHWYETIDDGWAALLNAGRMFEGLGDFESAMAHNEKAIVAFDRLRGTLSADQWKTTLASHPDAPYLYFQSARFALYWAEKQETSGNLKQSKNLKVQAFAFLEKGKGRALNDLLQASFSLPEGMNGQAYDAWQQASAQATAANTRFEKASKDHASAPDLDKLRQQAESARKVQEEAERKLYKAFPGFYEIVRREAPAADVAAIASLLPEGTVLLQFMQLSEHLLGFIVTKNGLENTHLAEIDVRVLNINIRKLHTACANGEPVTAAAAFSKIFLEPFKNQISKAKHLIISPFGEANKLPFHILPFEGQPLGISKTISYLPNAGLLHLLSSATNISSQTVSLLAIGNPSNMSWIDPETGKKQIAQSLPGAEEEAIYVATLFPKAQALTGSKATASAVRELAGQANLLHLSTHGYANPEAPFESSILLAEGEDLTVAELMGLRLSANLVVMSACETALGKQTGGNEVIGLARGLLAAGAKAAIVSLWPVDDQATRLLMSEFYRRLKAGETPCLALQSAQRYLSNLDRTQANAK